MDEKVVHQILDELLSSLEPLDTQTAALQQFLKAKGIATDEELAPYLEQAGNASNVRWLAARIRIGGLISSAMKPSEQPTESQTTTNKTSDQDAEESKRSAQKNETEPAPQSAQAADDHSTSEKASPAPATTPENKKQTNPAAPSDQVEGKDAA